MNEFGAVSYPAEHEVTAEEKTWGLFAHISILLGGLICLPPLGPLIIWLAKKDQSPFVTKHAKQALAFSIGVFIAIIVLTVLGIALACIGIGFIFMILSSLVGLAALGYLILGAIRANEGKYFEYPLTSSFVK